RHGLRLILTGSTLPNIPQSDSRGAQFRGFTGSQLLRPVRLLAPLDGSDWDTSPATGDFYFQASDGLVALPAAGYDYDIDWTPMSAGLAPAGMAASFAALAHQPANGDIFAVGKSRRNPVARRQSDNLDAAAGEEPVGSDKEGIGALARKRGKGRFDLGDR